MDAATRTVRWSTTPRPQECTGLVALPAHGIVVAACVKEGSVIALRLSDGARVDSHALAGLGTHLAVDAATATVFVALKGSGVGTTSIARLVRSAGSLLPLAAHVPVPVRWHEEGPALAVVPPARGKRVSHLVVAEEFSSVLLVLALPGLALVHAHDLGEMFSWAVAADL